ncbi:hypothetical protein [Blastococcus saxobsidens]|uniref:Uncharacterized protein n=1 Tax=Blastococcus saxobsidens (strain DD2) TaxID=1146883 RepID=H6RJS5_BLASD|nr:hypothetical protein [Blastococcus saxobsidens]CCG03578.1 protein of unknown function [Blastococcus saxobsidens DD2]
MVVQVERAATSEDSRSEHGTEVEAAVARWAAAAGVPESVAQGYESRTSLARRFLRGFLLGGLIGVPMLVFSSLDEPADGLWLVVALAVVLLVRRIGRHRTGSAG